MPPSLQILSLRRWQYRTGHESDRYWRMSNYAINGSMIPIRELLKAHNYPNNGPISQYQYLLHCIARSLPGYENCKLVELRRFAQERGLAGIENATRKHLAKTLRHADEKPRFARFLDLPVELRTTIYRLYCADFADKPLVMPTYPPPARANKQLRDEMLPVFYTTCTFSVGLVVDGYWQKPIAHALRMQRESTLFLKSLGAENLAHIQKLEVTFETPKRLRRQMRFAMRMVLPRDGKQATARIVVRDKHGGDHAEHGLFHPWNEGTIITFRRLRELEGRVVRFAETVQRRAEGDNHLLIEDVYRLRSLLEAFFEEQ